MTTQVEDHGMTEYRIQLESGVWLADIEGDPGRTLVEENAKVFPSQDVALKALEGARKYRPFENASIDSDFF